MPATVWPVCPMSLIELPTSRSVQPSPSQLKTQWSRDNATSGTPRLARVTTERNCGGLERIDLAGQFPG